jgi:hypothetical protein
LERNFTIQLLFQNKTQAPTFLFPKRHSPEIAGAVIGVSLIRRPDARKDLSTPRDLLQPTSGIKLQKCPSPGSAQLKFKLTKATIGRAAHRAYKRLQFCFR